MDRFNWFEHTWLRKYSKKCKKSPSSSSGLEGADVEAHKYKFKQPYTLTFAPGRQLWNLDRIKRNIEVVPLMVIIGGGLCALMGVVVHNIQTRDDVRYFKSWKYGYYQNKHFYKKRKLIIVKQKYKEVEGLRSLYKEMDSKDK